MSSQDVVGQFTEAGCGYPTCSSAQLGSSLSWEQAQVSSRKGDIDCYNQVLASLNSSSQQKQFKIKRNLCPFPSKKKKVVVKKGVNGGYPETRVQLSMATGCPEETERRKA
ncbi:hypothetical protein BTVI_54821 [Pitangus sulphuratus]|nr:hypothetical protein BTVI_54821 [Pitangus sulphuratus]